MVSGGGGSEESEGEKGGEGSFHGWFGMRSFLLDNNNVVALCYSLKQGGLPLCLYTPNSSLEGELTERGNVGYLS